MEKNTPKSDFTRTMELFYDVENNRRVDEDSRIEVTKGYSIMEQTKQARNLRL